MAQSFFKSFYNSKSWLDTREAYFVSKFGLCELCEKPGEEIHHKIFLRPENMNNADITLNWDNLQLLCKRCHNVQHEKALNLHREWNRKNPSTSQDTEFDADGNLIEHKKVTLVHGAPASGKTSYVSTHKKKYDIVVDLDYIMSALSLSNNSSRSPDTFPFALDVVALMHELISQRKYFFEHAWILTTMIDRRKRKQLAAKLNADIIHINTDRDTCLERAKRDDNRADKILHKKIINKYFDEYEPDIDTPPV